MLNDYNIKKNRFYNQIIIKIYVTLKKLVRYKQIIINI